MKIFLALTFYISFLTAFAQEHGFPYGQVTLKQFNQTVPARDSSAVAIVLNEFGEAYINDDSYKLIFEHHYIIKILKQEGIKEADIVIPLYKSDKNAERMLSVKAASYSVGDHGVQRLDLDTKNVFTENVSKDVDLKKFAIPNVQKGSIIEIYYTLESPFYVRNFRTWEFQSHLPKLASTYWATIPGNYNYNISWKGYLRLSKNENEIVKSCFNVGNGTSDCARYKFGMVNIPAFIEEDYMTAKSNFLASINFELLEIKHPEGGVDKVTNEWKDADNEMQRDQYFGGQIKKGKDISQKIAPVITGLSDPLEKAMKIYDFVKTWYKWNGYYGKYSYMGIKKAFEAKTGDIGDINLSLVAALRGAELDVEPLVLSTRKNGSPTELFPVLSDFNYVVAKLNIGDKTFMLDASDPYLQFGMLPERCLNGKGRVFPEKNPSYWHDLKPSDKYKRVTVVDLTLAPTGVFTGTIQRYYYGYSAVDKKKSMSSFNNQDAYLEDLKKNLNNIIVTKYDRIESDSASKPIIEKFEVELEGSYDLNRDNFLLNPFFLGKIESNPFRSNERLFPVDFGAPVENKMVVNITYPSSHELESAPDKTALSIPNSGGKFLFDVVELGNKVTVNYIFSIDRTVFKSVEYRSLKELYDRVIQTQNTDFLFTKKK